jgi:hypothetical protein
MVQAMKGQHQTGQGEGQRRSKQHCTFSRGMDSLISLETAKLTEKLPGFPQSSDVDVNRLLYSYP